MFSNRLLSAAMCAAIATAVPVTASAHDGVIHATPEEADAHLSTTNTPGFPEIKGGDFMLVDHEGNVRTSRDPNGQYQLLFFGYASCKAICSVALPRMIEAVELLQSKDVKATPLLITVDPERDTTETIANGVRNIHPRLVGLTGTRTALDEAYRAFHVERKLVYVHPDEGPIYAHGSFIYLLDPDGEFLTLFPPVLKPERMAEIVQTYLPSPTN